MKALAEINRTAVALILVLVLGGGGFLWWKLMYTPAVTARTSAETTATAAQAQLSEVNSRLAAAQQQVAEAKKADGGKLDDATGRMQISQQASPTEPLIDEAAFLLTKLADRSGITTSINVGEPDTSTDASAAGGAVPIDIKFEAGGTYEEMQKFIAQVEGTVEVKRGKMFVRGRMFNVVQFDLRSQEDEAASAQGETGTEEEGPGEELVLGPNDLRFTIVVRMYKSTFGAGAAAPALGTTPGATDPTTGAPATGTAPVTDPAAATGTAPAGASTDPAAAGAAAGATTTGATTTTSPTGTAPATGTDPAAVGTTSPSTTGATG